MADERFSVKGSDVDVEIPKEVAIVGESDSLAFELAQGKARAL
jgi:hypothetical protein